MLRTNLWTHICITFTYCSLLTRLHSSIRAGSLLIERMCAEDHTLLSETWYYSLTYLFFPSLLQFVLCTKKRFDSNRPRTLNNGLEKNADLF